VDDLSLEPGAGHIGESEFASSVFYKYAVCDLRQLRDNLAGDGALAARAMKAVALAIARAVPMGKKNSTAPQNPADYLEVIVRRDAPVSLANAFLKPVVPARDADVMTESIRRLREQGQKYDAAYGTDLLGRFVLPLREVDLGAGVTRCETLDQLASGVEKLVADAMGKLPA
jgi:CRISPR system Cascade subunit CasC